MNRHRIVLVEGNYLLLKNLEEWRRVYEIFDETWFVDCEKQIAMERVKKRHVSAFGIDEQQAQLRIDTNDGPNASLIEETKQHAKCVFSSVDDPTVITVTAPTPNGN